MYTNFSYASLLGATLEGARIESTNFIGADLDETSIRGAINNDFSKNRMGVFKGTKEEIEQLTQRKRSFGEYSTRTQKNS